MNLHQIEKLCRTRLEDVLVDEGILERSRVEDAQAEQETTGRTLGEILIEREILTDYDLAKLVATHYSLPYVDVAGYTLRREVVESLPAELCQTYGFLPIDRFGRSITLAVSEMPTQELIDEIVRLTEATPYLFVGQRRAIRTSLEDEAKRAVTRKDGRLATPGPKSVAAEAVQAAAAQAEEPAVPGEEPAPELLLTPVAMKLVSGPAT